MDNFIADVVIIGAGPAGLTLSAELASRNITCCIIEKKQARSFQSKAFSLTPLTLELLDMRGIAEQMVANGYLCDFAPLGDGKRQLSFKNLNTNFPFLLSISQEKTEEILEQWALSSGVKIFNNSTLTNLSQDNDKVSVIFENDRKLLTGYTKYLVGCDGTYSKVRKLAEIVTSDNKFSQSLMHGDMYLRNPPPCKIFAKTSHRGMIAIFPHKNNFFRVIALDHERMHVDVNKPLTLSEFEQSVNALSLQDFGLHNPLWLNRFNSQQKHAYAYRNKKILLAGDAAHTHMPAGGQGLQMAIQDAFNLGWKLATVIQKSGPENLLDTYESERWPINEVIMKRSIAMYRYEIANDSFSMFLKWIANKILSISFFKNIILKQLSGLSISYRKTIKRWYKHKISKHIGSIIRDHKVKLILPEKQIMIRIFEGLRSNKFLLIEAQYNAETQSYIYERYNAKIDYAVSANLFKQYSFFSCLIRPDGVIAWCSDKEYLRFNGLVLKDLFLEL